VHGQRPDVLIITDQEIIQAELENGNPNFNLRFADCEYRCSMLIEKFRPDYIIIDCSLGINRTREFARLLYEDPRIPFVKVVLVGNQDQLPEECNKMVFAMVNSNLTHDTLTALIADER